MELGLGKLGLSPKEFWGMAPTEVTAAFYGKFGRPTPPLTREDVKRMEKSLSG